MSTSNLNSATIVPPIDKPYYGIGLGGAIGRYFRKYATFSGRASRSEYWWAWLFVGVVTAVLSVLTKVPGVGEGFGIAGLIWLVATIIPNLSLGVRRLHDSNRSGWFVLLPSVFIYAGQFVADFALEHYMGNSSATDGGAFSGVMAGGVLLAIGAVLTIALYVAKSRPEGARFDK